MRASQRSNRPGVERHEQPETGVGERRHPLGRRRSRGTVAMVAGAGAALIIAALAGCSASNGSMSADRAPMDAPAGAESLDGAVTLEAEGAADAATGTIDVDRAVVTTGDVRITVDDPVEAAAEAVRLTQQAGGRVDQRTENPGPAGDPESASASLALRIPADALDAVLDDLRELGDVTSVTMDATDVSQQHDDLDARISALETSIGRMTALLAEAEDIGDLMAIESELTTRQADLDALVQQRDGLDDRIAYSTLTVGLTTVAVVVAPEPAPEGFWGGLVAGWNALLFFLGWVGVVLGVLLPWLLAALVVAMVVVAIVRVVRGGRARGADAAAEAADGDARVSGDPGDEARDGGPSGAEASDHGLVPRA
ncbi:DUF4349 domain-containing protein [Agromyces sp. CF514]|uniref:DUF4349 domain-containing protein n=1 Tax=Agromyces sp. CF514 TaxID=1881031 RepID=UPI000B884C5F|nr:DUF4349 domain-containing protein [Agromyces sp. CF514]